MRSPAKLLKTVGAAIVGSLGWSLGAKAGIMTAVFASAVGTGLGIFIGGRIAHRLDL